MRSKLHIKGHPLHPILVSFPITFFCAAFALDLIFLFTHKEMFSRVAHFLGVAGIVSALFAAVPGILDYFRIVPPNSSANKRGTQHAILNSTVVFIFIIVVSMRSNNISQLIILSSEGIACALLTIAGWMGGTLVIRNQIGVDHRYAYAGKWSEERINTDSKTIELKDVDKLLVNQMKLFHINGKRIVVGRTENGFVAFDDRCTHRGGSLADGVMICGTVQCPWHGSQFDTNTGWLKAGPAKEDIKTYRIKNHEQNYYLIITGDVN